MKHCINKIIKIGFRKHFNGILLNSIHTILLIANSEYMRFNHTYTLYVIKGKVCLKRCAEYVNKL